MKETLGSLRQGRVGFTDVVFRVVVSKVARRANERFLQAWHKPEKVVARLEQDFLAAQGKFGGVGKFGIGFFDGDGHGAYLSDSERGKVLNEALPSGCGGPGQIAVERVIGWTAGWGFGHRRAGVGGEAVRMAAGLGRGPLQRICVRGG